MEHLPEKYQFIDNEPIIRGAYGAIYLIRDRRVRTEFILKRIRKEFSSKEIYENEIDFLFNLKGPNIINIFDYFIDDKYYNLILEKMDGDLEQLLQTKYKKGMPSKIYSPVLSI